MPADRPEISEDQVIPGLWKRYLTTDEYRHSRRVYSISSVHPLVRAAEEKGLQKLVQVFIGKLSSTANIRELYTRREKSEWVYEWCKMNDILLKYVYKDRGEIRKLGQDVRFGSPGDEERHRIPLGGPHTSLELYALAERIGPELAYINANDLEAVCEFLARTHYEFIRIHPFMDGNGRIARALTDQIAISLGLPPIIAGFPRTVKEKKEKYHAAISGCADDRLCVTLKIWIQSQMVERLRSIA